MFAAFQSNLLSQISHELKTPLTGVLNSLVSLEEALKADSPHWNHLSRLELLKTARNHAEKLNQSLGSILDLAAIESANFHVRLQEVHLPTFVKAKLGTQASLKIHSALKRLEGPDLRILADPKKLGQAIDLCQQMFQAQVGPQGKITVCVSTHTVSLEGKISDAAWQVWEDSWTQAQIAFQSGAASPHCVFGVLVQSEQAFLSRQEEGLGSEFLLIHEIMKLHHGKFELKRENQSAKILLILPELNSQEGLQMALSSRAYAATTGVGSLSLLLIEFNLDFQPDTPPDTLKNTRRKRLNQMFERVIRRIRSKLPRAADAVYRLGESMDCPGNCPDNRYNRLAIVLEDCKKGDLELLCARFMKWSGLKQCPEILAMGSASCPADTSDPAGLLQIADERLDQNRKVVELQRLS